MNLGIIAHNSKKVLIEDFCIAYKNILAKHEVYATGTTGRRIEEATNLLSLIHIFGIPVLSLLQKRKQKKATAGKVQTAEKSPLSEQPTEKPLPETKISLPETEISLLQEKKPDIPYGLSLIHI